MPVVRLVVRLQLIALLGLAVLLAASGGASAQTTFSTLYFFQGVPDRALPEAGLIFTASGALYGTTYWGGITGSPCAPFTGLGLPGCGTVFKLTPPATSGGAWTESVLYSFTGGSDGAGPTPA